MFTAMIEEPVHNLNDLIKKYGVPVKLLQQFLDGIDAKIKVQGKYSIFKTHIKGLTGFSNSKNAFTYIDFRQNSLSIKYYTGDRMITGLSKANWHVGGDNKGSEPINLNYTATTAEMNKAVEYAVAAYVIAVNEFGT